MHMGGTPTSSLCVQGPESGSGWEVRAAVYHPGWFSSDFGFAILSSSERWLQRWLCAMWWRKEATCSWRLSRSLLGICLLCAGAVCLACAAAAMRHTPTVNTAGCRQQALLCPQARPMCCVCPCSGICFLLCVWCVCLHAHVQKTVLWVQMIQQDMTAQPLIPTFGDRYRWRSASSRLDTSHKKSLPTEPSCWSPPELILVVYVAGWMPCDVGSRQQTA